MTQLQASAAAVAAAAEAAQHGWVGASWGDVALLGNVARRDQGLGRCRADLLLASKLQHTPHYGLQRCLEWWRVHAACTASALSRMGHDPSAAAAAHRSARRHMPSPASLPRPSAL